MPLDKNRLKADLLAAFESTKNIQGADAQQNKLAEKLAEAIDDYVRAARVKDVTVSLINGKQAGEVALK